MDFNSCSRCGSEIEGKGILFRKRNFCSDECCEEFEEDFQTKGEPQVDDLGDDDTDDLDDDDLGFEEGDDEDDDFLDDDYLIAPGDF